MRQVMMVMVNAGANNNKFYELTETPNGVRARYGRIGGTEQVRMYPHGSFGVKLDEKRRKGYVVRETDRDTMPITASQLASAKALLGRMGSGQKTWNVVEQYLTLFPQKVAQVGDTSWITPTWIKGQMNEISALESLIG